MYSTSGGGNDIFGIGRSDLEYGKSFSRAKVGWTRQPVGSASVEFPKSSVERTRNGPIRRGRKALYVLRSSGQLRPVRSSNTQESTVRSVSFVFDLSIVCSFLSCS